ncbi:MAG: hypothetical protein JO020_21485 [Chloroflexi bacterium]|nr:hypothetical protein [Chloroflexota bacterium]
MELRETQRASGAGGLYVTHDPAEALAISDRVAILRHGRLVQQGSPEEVYTTPLDEWLASLTGPASIELSTSTGRLVARVPGPPRYAIGTPVEWNLTSAAVLSGPVVSPP